MWRLCWASFAILLVRATNEHGSVSTCIEDGDLAYPSYTQAHTTDSCGPSPDSLSVDARLLQEQIEELALFSDTPPPSVTRILYSQNDVAARRYIRNLMQSSGLHVREDCIGNIFGLWEGSDPSGAAIATGSHIDAIPYAGKYDGVVGVLGAIEAINALKRLGFIPKKSLEVVMFTSEEPTRFGISCLGSRVLGGSREALAMLEKAVDNSNVSFIEAAKQAGYDNALENLSEVPLKNSTYSAFVELHIEQGVTLEQEGLHIGVVTAIAAPASLKVGMKGDGGHAGTVLMPFRKDAGLAAAELALLVEKHILTLGSIDTVGTTGVFEVHPGAVNSIPSQAHLEIDVRDIDEERRNKVIEKIKFSALEISSRRGIKLEKFEVINQDPPAVTDPSIIEAIELASDQLGLKHKRLISRAYHDSLFMARVSPVGMIFIPCYRGYSHRADEFASIDDIVNGVKVLALSLSRLSAL